MRLLVIGCGRGGTSWLAQILKASEQFEWKSSYIKINLIEDRNLFRHMTMCENYATKITTEEPSFTFDKLEELILKYPDLKILFIIRHPVSICMSKIVRGQAQKINKFGYSKKAPHKPNIENQTIGVKKMYAMLEKVGSNYSERLRFVKMESLFDEKSRAQIIADLCIWLEINYKPLMMRGHELTNNRHHIKSYNKKIDHSQKDIHKNWKTAFGGFFKKDDIKLMNSKFKKLIIKYYGI